RPVRNTPARAAHPPSGTERVYRPRIPSAGTTRPSGRCAPLSHLEGRSLTVSCERFRVSPHFNRRVPSIRRSLESANLIAGQRLSSVSYLTLWTTGFVKRSCHCRLHATGDRRSLSNSASELDQAHAVGGSAR